MESKLLIFLCFGFCRANPFLQILLAGYSSNRVEIVGATEAPENYRLYDDRDCYGDDFKKIARTTLEECKEECDTEPRCLAIQFNTLNECYLKSRRCEYSEMTYTGNGRMYNKIRVEVPTTPSAPVRYEYTHLRYKDCPHRDIKGIYDVSRTKCQSECDKLPECLSFQHNVYDTCWLKRYRCSTSELTSTRAGHMFQKIIPVTEAPTTPSSPGGYEYIHLEHKDCKNRDIKGIYDISRKKCQSECDKLPECLSFQHNTLDTCWLKYYRCSPEELTSASIGHMYQKVIPVATVAPEGEESCEAYGVEILEPQLRQITTANKGECKAACLEDARCKSSSMDSVTRRCVLVSDVREDKIAKNRNSIIFIKDCEDDDDKNIAAITQEPSVSCTLTDKGNRGSDIKDGYYSTQARCRQDCLADSTCVASTLDNRDLCWLHYAVSKCDVYEKSGFKLFIKTCSDLDLEDSEEESSPETLGSCVAENYGHRGADLRKGYYATADQCKEDCINDDQCLGSTHDIRNKCWLHAVVMKCYLFQEEGFTLFMKHCQVPQDETTTDLPIPTQEVIETTEATSSGDGSGGNDDDDDDDDDGDYVTIRPVIVPEFKPPGKPLGIGLSSRVGVWENKSVSWDAPYGRVSHYILRWGESDKSNLTYKTMQFPASVRRYQVTGLKALTTYDFSISAKNAAGEGPRRHITVTTSGRPPSAPRELSVTKQSTSGRANVTWTAPEEMNGHLRSYFLTYWMDGHEDEMKTVNITPPVNAYSLKLSYGSTYYFGLTAKNEHHGQSPPANTSITTPPEAPVGAPEYLNVIATDKVAGVSWKDPDSFLLNGKVDFYMVEYKQKGKEIPIVRRVQKSPIWLRDLKKGRDYYLRVRIHNDSGYGPWSPRVVLRLREKKRTNFRKDENGTVQGVKK